MKLKYKEYEIARNEFIGIDTSYLKPQNLYFIRRLTVDTFETYQMLPLKYYISPKYYPSAYDYIMPPIIDCFKFRS